MLTPLAYALVAAGLVIAVWAGVAAARDRRVSGAQLLTAAVVEVVLVVQAVIAMVLLARDGDGVEPVTFIGYWLTAVLLLPVGAFWAIGERSRWGNGVLALSGLVVAVLLLRLVQLWTAGA